MRNGFLGYVFGSGFLNMLPIDFPWYFMWYSHIFAWVLQRELKIRIRQAQTETPERDEGGTPSLA
jgi:hypothetical protein